MAEFVYLPFSLDFGCSDVGFYKVYQSVLGQQFSLILR